MSFLIRPTNREKDLSGLGASPGLIQKFGKDKGLGGQVQDQGIGAFERHLVGSARNNPEACAFKMIGKGPEDFGGDGHIALPSQDCNRKGKALAPLLGRKSRQGLKGGRPDLGINDPEILPADPDLPGVRPEKGRREPPAQGRTDLAFGAGLPEGPGPGQKSFGIGGRGGEKPEALETLRVAFGKGQGNPATQGEPRQVESGERKGLREFPEILHPAVDGERAGGGQGRSVAPEVVGDDPDLSGKAREERPEGPAARSDRVKKNQGRSLSPGIEDPGLVVREDELSAQKGKVTEVGKFGQDVGHLDHPGKSGIKAQVLGKGGEFREIDPHPEGGLDVDFKFGGESSRGKERHGRHLPELAGQLRSGVDRSVSVLEQKVGHVRREATEAT